MTVGSAAVGSAAVGSTVSFRQAATLPNRTLQLKRPPGTSSPGVGGVGATAVGGGVVASGRGGVVNPTISVVYTGPLTADVPNRTLQLTRKPPSATGAGGASVSAPQRGLTLSRLTPGISGTGSASVTPPGRVIQLRRPAPLVGFPNWIIAGNDLPTTPDESATDTTLSLSARVQSSRIDKFRPLKSDQGKLTILDSDDGGYVAVDRADGSNTFNVIPPLSRRPLRQSLDYHVEDYEETLVSQSVDEFDVELELVRSQNRTDTPSISESRGSGEWAFDTRLGQITTDRVDAEFIGRGGDGVKRFELIVRFDFNQSHAFEAALSRLGGVRVREIPDASNQAVDETNDNAATVNITSPVSSDVVPDGDYVVTEWDSTRITDAYQEITFVVAET